MDIKNRLCGSCTVCCTEEGRLDFSFNENGFIKEDNKTCPYLDTTCNMCGVHKDRPKVCRDFDCSWIYGFGEEKDRPDKSGLLVYEQNINNGHWIIFLETEKGALFNSKSMVLDIINKRNTAGIVVKYGSDDFVGDWTVVKNKDLDRAKSMVGENIGWISDNVGVYELKR